MRFVRCPGEESKTQISPLHMPPCIFASAMAQVLFAPDRGFPAFVRDGRRRAVVREEGAVWRTFRLDAPRHCKMGAVLQFATFGGFGSVQVGVAKALTDMSTYLLAHEEAWAVSCVGFSKTGGQDWRFDSRVVRSTRGQITIHFDSAAGDLALAGSCWGPLSFGVSPDAVPYVSVRSGEVFIASSWFEASIPGSQDEVEVFDCRDEEYWHSEGYGDYDESCIGDQPYEGCNV